MPTTKTPPLWWAIIAVLTLTLAVLTAVVWLRPTQPTVTPGPSPTYIWSTTTPTPIQLNTPTPTPTTPVWTVIEPAEILPPLFNGLPINQFNHPETLGGLPLNHQKSFITVYVGAGRYTKGGTYDKEFTLRVVRGAIRPHDFNMEADDLKNPQHYGRLTCGRTGPRDSLFVCLAYAEDAVILAEDTGPGEITDEEIIAMTNEYLDHALNLRNP